MNWGDALTMLRYDDRWRKSRRLIHPWLHKKAAEDYHPAQELEARLLLKRLWQAAKENGSEYLDAEFYRPVLLAN
jgi:cytochrome P450